MIERIIILGHDGFIGHHLSRYLRKNHPQCDMYGFSAPKTDLTHLAEAQKIAKHFTNDATVVMLSGIKPAVGDTLETFSQNISMMVNVCSILDKHPVARFVYMSSAAVYGEDVHNTNISEWTPIDPRSYYGLAKYISERLLEKICNEQKRRGLIILRPPAIYGPGEGTVSYNPAGLLYTAKATGAVTIWGDGSERREFIYIDDAVEIIARFLFHPYDGVVNIASGTSYTFGEIIATITKLLGKKTSIRTKNRSKEKVDHVFNNQLLRSLVPKFHFTTLEEGLKKLL